MVNQSRYSFKLKDDEQEDLASDIWVRTFGIRQDRRSWLGYVLRVMQNAKNDYLKARNKKGGVGLGDINDYRTTDYESATAAMVSSENPIPPLEILLPPTVPEYERDAFIKTCLAQLTSKERSLLHDYFWRQLTYREMGRERGVSVQTAINWVRHAERRFLRAAQGKRLNNMNK